jgi:hypothetical protein
MHVRTRVLEYLFIETITWWIEVFDAACEDATATLRADTSACNSRRARRSSEDSGSGMCVCLLIGLALAFVCLLTCVQWRLFNSAFGFGDALSVDGDGMCDSVDSCR